MKSSTAQLIIVALLFISAAVLWTAGNAERQLAEAERLLVSLRYERAAEAFDAAAQRSGLPGLVTDVVRASTTAADRRTTAQYWMGDYDQFVSADDPALRMLAANSAYRAMRRQGGPRAEVAAKLDDLAKRYAGVLRDEPGNEDAAYNYEFVLRFRTAVASARQAIPGADPASTGITVHGQPGGPPDDSDTKKFKMIVPMQPDERMEAEEAGRSGRKVRKG